MALQASGAISLANIQTEFGGSNPISLSEYYRDGAYVGAGAPNVPTSGVIDLQDFYGAQAAIILTISSNASEQNILTLATAAGYNAATDSTPIILTINSGVTISGSSTHALRTGALNANSDLTINVNGNIHGYTGGTGAAGGDAIYFETNTGGTGTYSVVGGGGSVVIGGGKGGGGSGGSAGARYAYGYDDNDKQFQCQPYGDGGPYYGSAGAKGADGSDFGQSGSSGHAGTFGGGSNNCLISSPGSGSPGGAGGFAVRKNGRTVSTTGTTYKGSTS